jgi:hypothetical protein
MDVYPQVNLSRRCNKLVVGCKTFFSVLWYLRSNVMNWFVVCWWLQCWIRGGLRSGGLGCGVGDENDSWYGSEVRFNDVCWVSCSFCTITNPSMWLRGWNSPTYTLDTPLLQRDNPTLCLDDLVLLYNLSQL